MQQSYFDFYTPIRCDFCGELIFGKVFGYNGTNNCSQICASKSRWKTQRKFINSLKSKGCEICGYNKSMHALVFHHKNKYEKEYEIGDIYSSSMDKIYNEIKKCQLLCMNCHAELHEREGYL